MSHALATVLRDGRRPSAAQRGFPRAGWEAKKGAGSDQGGGHLREIRPPGHEVGLIRCVPDRSHAVRGLRRTAGLI